MHLWTFKYFPTDRATRNVNSLITASSQLAVLREPKLRLFEVEYGMLRLRADKQSEVPLADLPANDAAGEVRVLGVMLRPGSSGVGGTTLKRAAVSYSVQRAIERSKVDGRWGEQASGSKSPSGLAIDAIRKALGSLDAGTPEDLAGTLYASGDQSIGSVNVKPRYARGSDMGTKSAPVATCNTRLCLARARL